MWVRVPPSVPFIMKEETKDDLKAGGIGVILVLVIVWALTGCTHTIYRSPLDVPQGMPDYTPVAQLDRASAF